MSLDQPRDGLEGAARASTVDAADHSSSSTVLITLVLVYALNFLDRQFLSVVAEPIKRDLHLSDTQLGLLTGLSFAIFYTVFGIPIARLADRGDRVRIVSAACAIWSVFTALCGLATGFYSLAFARVGVGFGEPAARLRRTASSRITSRPTAGPSPSRSTRSASRWA